MERFCNILKRTVLNHNYMHTQASVYETLQTIIDPEIGIDIVTLGLIRAITVQDNSTHVLMTLTTPLCPYADVIIQEVEDSLTILGCLNVHVELTFDPPWEPSAELRAILGA
jgi:metal-sulfur cluster biosynthetic enzyme